MTEFAIRSTRWQNRIRNCKEIEMNIVLGAAYLWLSGLSAGVMMSDHQIPVAFIALVSGVWLIVGIINIRTATP